MVPLPPVPAPAASAVAPTLPNRPPGFVTEFQRLVLSREGDSLGHDDAIAAPETFHFDGFSGFWIEIIAHQEAHGAKQNPGCGSILFHLDVRHALPPNGVNTGDGSLDLDHRSTQIVRPAG